MAAIKPGTYERETQRLMRGLNFTSEDLAANRQRRMSERQRQRLRPAQPGAVAWIAILAHFGLIIGIVGTLMLAARVAFGNAALVIGLVAGSLLLPILMLYFGRSKTWTDMKDVTEGEVRMVRGRIRLESGERFLIFHRAWIGNRRFDLSRKAFFAFTDQQTYCIYITPGKGSILSAEPCKLDDADG